MGMEFERWKPYFLALRLLGNFRVLQDFLNLEYQRCSVERVNGRAERVQRNEHNFEALVISGHDEDVRAMLSTVGLLAGDSSNRLGHYPLVRVLSMGGEIEGRPPAYETHHRRHVLLACGHCKREPLRLEHFLVFFLFFCDNRSLGSESRLFRKYLVNDLCKLAQLGVR